MCGLFQLLCGSLLLFGGCGCGSFSSGSSLLLLGLDEGTDSHTQRLVGFAHVGIQRRVAAYWAGVRKSGLAVLADGRVAALELEGIDGEFATGGASQLCRDLRFGE